MAYPVLYSFRRCPYAMRARMALYASGIKCELREIVLRDKPRQMLDISPKGTVPVLSTPDNTTIDESLDIMYWALRQNDPQHWLNADSQRINKLIQHNDTDFKANLDRYKYPNKYPNSDTSDARNQALKTLYSYEKNLSRHPYLLGDKPCLADIAIFPFIRQFSNVNKDWFATLPLPELHRWLKEFLESSLFLKTMEKRATWTPDSAKAYIN